jgi:prolyl-tRNA synthetase
MLWSETLIPTLREAPADAEISSHKLLVRAGLVRKLAGGIYTFLPLGLRTLRKIEAIIRDELNAAGAIEVLMPALQPVELWQRGPRYEAARRVMFQVRSNASATADYVLGPTHEEACTDMMSGIVNSWRHLPRTLYQIQTKFRDEIRPRFGLMRCREFVMKDAYSYDVDDAGAIRSYEAMYAAYVRIFQRVGLHAKPVEADTGVMGGSYSHEFAVPCEVGESEIVYTDDGSYAAAIEKAASALVPRPSNPEPGAGPSEFPTPGIVTIAALAAAGVPAHDQIKTLVLLCDSAICLVLLRGDHTLNEAKLGALGFHEHRPATDTEIAEALGAKPGSLGAVASTLRQPFRIFADSALEGQHGMTTGANRDGFHLRDVSVPRDIAVERFLDLRLVQPGDTTDSGAPLRIARAIEVGHVFKLGTKYSEAFSANYLDAGGRTHPCVMGCYGIGVTRTLQAVIEQSHDADGILWPASVAPFQVVIALLDAALLPDARAVQKELADAGIDSIIDDREERPGVKFKDADLIGFPVRVTVGEKSRQAGGVEIKRRGTKDSAVVPIAGIAARAKELLGA